MTVAAGEIPAAGIPPAPSERQMDRLVSVVAPLARDNVRALMRDGQHVLVFPGGGGEVFKQRGQKYQLIWKERLGFARAWRSSSGIRSCPSPPSAPTTGPTLLPRPERLYPHFGQPIDTTRFDGRQHDDGAARALRDEARAAVEHGLEVLFAEREADPAPALSARAVPLG